MQHLKPLRVLYIKYVMCCRWELKYQLKIVIVVFDCNPNKDIRMYMNCLDILFGKDKVRFPR